MKWFNCFGVNGDFQRNVFSDLYQKTPLKHVPISLSLYEGKTEKFFFTNIVVSSAYLFARHVFFYFFEKGCLLLESVSNYVSPGSGFVPKIMYGWSYISTYRPFSILYLSPDLISPAHSLVCFVFTSQLARWRVTETLISFLSGNSDTSCSELLASDWSASGLTGLWLEVATQCQWEEQTLFVLPPLLQRETQTWLSWQMRNSDNNFMHSFRNSYGSSLYLLSVFSELSLLDLKLDFDL